MPFSLLRIVVGAQRKVLQCGHQAMPVHGIGEYMERRTLDRIADQTIGKADGSTISRRREGKLISWSQDRDPVGLQGAEHVVGAAEEMLSIGTRVGKAGTGGNAHEATSNQIIYRSDANLAMTSHLAADLRQERCRRQTAVFAKMISLGRHFMTGVP